MIKSRRMKRAGHVASMGERREAYRGKEIIWKTRRRGEDNIKMDIQQVGIGGTDWIDVAQVMDRCRAALVNVVMKVRVPYNAGNFLTS
jgi:hypothetical protein